MELAQTYSDLYKDVYGVRPKHEMCFDEHELREHINQLEDQLVQEMLDEKERQIKASQEFWKRIKKMMIDYNVNMPTAIRWCMQAESETDLEHYLWLNDLSWEEIRKCKDEFGHLFT